MKKYLYIDDERNPKTDRDWIIVRTSKEAIEYMQKNGCPDYISFDHDLGGDDTAMIVVKWMVEEDLNTKKFFKPTFEFNVHSANPIGAANIKGYLTAYFKSKEKS